MLFIQQVSSKNALQQYWYHPRHKTSSHAHPAHGTHLCAFPGIKLGPHIQVEARPGLAVGAAGVKVDNVVDPRAAAVDDPVVAVKRRHVAEDCIDSRLGRHAVVFVGKGFKLRSAASAVSTNWLAKALPLRQRAFIKEEHTATFQDREPPSP